MNRQRDITEKFVFTSSNEQIFKWISDQLQDQTDIKNFLDNISQTFNNESIQQVTWLTNLPITNNGTLKTDLH